MGGGQSDEQAALENRTKPRIHEALAAVTSTRRHRFTRGETHNTTSTHLWAVD